MSGPVDDLLLLRTVCEVFVFHNHSKPLHGSLLLSARLPLKPLAGSGLDFNLYQSLEEGLCLPLPRLCPEPPRLRRVSSVRRLRCRGSILLRAFRLTLSLRGSLEDYPSIPHTPPERFEAPTARCRGHRDDQ